MNLPFKLTECRTWFERDRAHVNLVNKLTDETILEFWDDDVYQLVEDGFLDAKDFHRSAYEYAEYLTQLPIVPEGGWN